MASTYTNLGIEKMVTGEQAGLWGDKTNTNLEILEQISGGYISKQIAAGTNTLTVTNGGTGSEVATSVIEFTSSGALGSAATVTIPDSTEMNYILKNSTTGGQDITFKTASGTGVTWSTTTTKIVYSNGTNVIEVQTGGDVVDDTSPQLGGNLDTNSFNIIFDDAHGITDENSNEQLIFETTASAVNHVDLTNAATGNSPQIGAVGDDTNISLKLRPKATGNVEIMGATNPGSIQLNCENNSHGIKLTSPPHASGQSYELKFPTGNVTAERFLKVASVSGSGTTGIGQLSFAEVSGGTSWQAVKTGNFTAVAGEGYFVDTTSTAIEMDLPAGSIGDEISFIDYAGTFDTNALTIDQNGTEKIAGSTDPLTVSTERAANTLVYVDGTQGWLLKNN
jgi:hypothetical protein